MASTVPVFNSVACIGSTDWRPLRKKLTDVFGITMSNWRADFAARVPEGNDVKKIASDAVVDKIPYSSEV